MANTLTAPIYSFVQVSDPATPTCVTKGNQCLPLMDFNGLKCQLLSDDYTPSDCGGGAGTDNYWYLFPTKVPIDIGDMIPVFGTLPLPRVINNNKRVENGIPSGTTVIPFDTVPADFDTFDELNAVYSENPIEVGDCFVFNVILEGEISETDTICSRECIAHTNCFYRSAADCFISVVEYNNRSNAFDFQYFKSDGTTPALVKNVITLPIYLETPKPFEDKKMYKKSDGANLKIYERIDEDWTMRTQWLPYWFHKRMQVVAAHDYVNINNQLKADIDAGAISVVATDTYTPEYVVEAGHAYFQLAKATQTLRNANPISLINNNC